MNKKIFAAVAAVVLFSACADTGNTSDSSFINESEALGSALEKYAETENPYAFLPENVRLDDDYHAREVISDGEGYVDLSKLGFRFTQPSGTHTFVFEHDPWDEDDPWNNSKTGLNLNYSCVASAFLTTDFFPDITDHIRLCYWTEVEVKICTLEEYNERALPEMQLSESEYEEVIKRNFERTINYISYHEDTYCYDYNDPDNLYGKEDTDSIDENELPPKNDSAEDFIFYVDCYTTSEKKHIAPGSELTNKQTEFIELSNDCFGYKITYDQTRYGFPMEKHVYWLYKRGQTRLHRIEFSYDKRLSEHLIKDEQGFLDSLELVQPTIEEEGSCAQNYFGFPNQME